jgi:hypothetical protein
MKLLQFLLAGILAVVLLIGVGGVVVVYKVARLVDQTAAAEQHLVDTVDTHSTRLLALETTVQSAADQQKIYYRATGKALAIATIDAARLIKNLDTDRARLSDDAHALLTTTAGAVETGENAVVVVATDAHKQIELQGYELQQTLSTARGALRELEGASLKLNKAAGDVEPMMEQALEAEKNIVHATESVKIALEPLRKAEGKLKVILRFLLGIPKVMVRP